MTTNTPGGGDNLDTSLRLIWESVGDAKIEAALKRIQAKQEQYYANIEKRANRVATSTDQITKALDRVNRSASLERVQQSFVNAAKYGLDYETTLKRIAPQLEKIGATQAEVNKVIADASRQIRTLSDEQTKLTGAQALQTFGREARLAAPAIPIPGTGLSSEAIFRVSEVAGKLGFSLRDLAIGGGLALGAVVALGLAFKNFEAVTKPVIDQFYAVFKARQNVAGLLAGGNAQEIVDARAEALDKLDRLEAERTRAIQDAAAAQGSARDSGILGQLLVGAGDLGVGPLAGLNTAVSELDTKIATAKTDLDALNPVYQKYLDQLEAERIQRQQESNLDTVRQAELAALQGSPDALNERIKALQQENDLIQRDLNTYALSAEKQEELRTQMDLNNAVIDRLNGTVREQVEATDRAAKAEEYLVKQRKELADLTQKYNDDVDKVEQQAADKRLDAQQRLNDRLVDIAQKAADAADDVLRKLEQKRADLAKDLGFDLVDAEAEAAQKRLDTEIKYQRDEAKAAREHADKLAEIQRKSRLDQNRAIQDRDAVAKVAAEEQLTADIETENKRFDAQKRERDIAFRDELSDQRTQFNRERQQRYQKYQRDLQDAQEQYNRELEQQDINKQRQLRDLAVAYQQEETLLKQKTAAQLKLIRDAYAQELAIIAQGQAARLKLEAQQQAQLYAQAQRLLQFGTTKPITTFGSNGPVRTMAGGGILLAGQAALVNEIRRESFTDRRGRTIPLPEGMGYFTPTQSGRVNPNGSGTTINLNLNGATIETMESTSKVQAMQVYSDILDRIGVA